MDFQAAVNGKNNADLGYKQQKKNRYYISLQERTVSFQVTLKDLDVPIYNHGGGTVHNDGTGIIPKRVLKADI